jgi:hypothetical protein
MSNTSLAEGLFLYPTPGGVYYASASTDDDRSRRFIQMLLKEPKTPALTLDNLRSLMEIEDDQKCLDLLLHCQKLGWVQGVEEQMSYPDGTLEEILPWLLNNVCESGKILLADDQGFYLSSNGFPHEVAEELSALSAEIATIHERRTGLLMNNMGLASHAWAIIDSAGNNKVGFWPMFIGDTRFVLILSGVPHFNQPDFVSLIWALSIRYSKTIA